MFFKAVGGGGLELAFDFILAEVIEAVRRLALTFARSTNATSRSRVFEARERLRRELLEGLTAGDPVTQLAARVGKIFNDPHRAFAIATTEASRAMHAGRMEAARSAGVWGQRWQASSDACEKCLAIDGKEVPMGTPFHVDPKGGPYAVTYHAPLHVHCQCTTQDVFLPPAGA